MSEAMTAPVPSRRKLAFFVQPGLDNFLRPIIDGLRADYEIQTVVTSTAAPVESIMKWADVCWFEWCDGLVLAASALPVSLEKKVICRLHSYEAFTSYVHQVQWSTIDRVVFVGPHIKDYVVKHVPQLRERETVVIPNGIRLENYAYRDRAPGFHLAYVGYINYKKGPMLLLHAFKALHDRDPRYHLHIAGSYQDARFQLYTEQMIETWGLETHIHFDGWQNDVNAYLEDKDYIVCSSPLESQHLSIMEAMAKGIKPLIHNFYGATQVYEAKVIWSTIDEFVSMVSSEVYDSPSYRSFVEHRYAFDTQLGSIKSLIADLCAKQSTTLLTATDRPLVTVGIINYNYAHYLDTCIQSVLSQTYANLEILVVDDCSTDDSIEKIRGYVEKYPHVRAIFHTENSGTEATALREIFHDAKGDYMMWINADDFLPHADVITHYSDCLQANADLDYVYGDLILVNEQGHVTDEWRYQQYTPAEVVRAVFDRMGSGVIPMAGMYRLSWYRNAGYDWEMDAQNTNAGDTLNCLINVHRGWNFQYLPKPGLCHRRHQSNLSYDVRKRIVSLISVLEYLTSQFDAALYLPHFPWNSWTDEEKAAQTHHAIGRMYWRMRQSYASLLPSDSEAQRQGLQPLTERVRHHLTQSLAVPSLYRDEIEEMWNGL